MTSAPARAWFSAWRDQRLDRLVVEDRTSPSAHEPVVAVAGVGVERDVGDEAKLRKLALDRAAGAADKIALVQRFASLGVFERDLGVGEERNRRNLEVDRPLGLAHRFFDGQAVDAGHRVDRDAAFVAVDEEERPDKIVRRQDVLAPRAAASSPPCGCGAGDGGGRDELTLRYGTACSWGRGLLRGSYTPGRARGNHVPSRSCRIMAKVRRRPSAQARRQSDESPSRGCRPWL